jgi:tetratricopeptide (TPR) repeat protein
MRELFFKYKWPLVIFLAAFLLRLIYLLQFRSVPSFEFPMVDELWHINWAREINSGNFWGDTAYFRGPLYPYILALFLKITGDSIFWSRFLQIVIAGGSAVMVFLIGRKLFSQTAAIIAGLIYAVYGTLIFYETMFLIPVIYIFLLLLAVYLLIIFKGSGKLWYWLGAGFVLGLAAIARPNILLLAPLLMIWIYLTHDKQVGIKKKLTTATIFLAGILIPVFSVTARNYIITGEAILISSQGGVNIYIGNNPDADGLTMLMPEVAIDENLTWSEFTAATRKAAEQEAGHSLTPANESAFWTDKTIKFISSNPLKFIELTFRKLVYFLVGFENSDNADIYFRRNFSSLFSILLWQRPIFFPFGLLLPLALAGAAYFWKNRREHALLYIMIIGYIPTVILFLVTSRHRLPIIPFLAIFAGAAVLPLVQSIRYKKWKKAIIPVGFLVVSLILVNRTYFEIGFQNLAQIHFNLALSYERQGNFRKAEAEYLEALKNDPYSSMMYNNLGHVQYQIGKYDEALKSYQGSLRIDPRNAEALNNMALIFEATSKIEEAEGYYKRAININPDLYPPYINLGDLYLGQNDLIRAELTYLQAIEISPENSRAYFKLGSLYGRQKEFKKAEDTFAAGAEYGQLSATDYVNWGNIYYQTGRSERAIELYKTAIDHDPPLIQAYFNLALAYYNFGYPRDLTKATLQKILDINPGHGPARQLLQQLGE